MPVTVRNINIYCECILFQFGPYASVVLLGEERFVDLEGQFVSFPALRLNTDIIRVCREMRGSVTNSEKIVQPITC